MSIRYPQVHLPILSQFSKNLLKPVILHFVIVFIIGNARSGTTWLHRAVTASKDGNDTASNDTFFTTMLTWEIFFAASVTWRKLFILLHKLDGLIGSPVFSIIRFVDTTCFGSITIHPVGLFKAEEDEWIMMV